jgi:hypothetical protein
MRACDLLVLIVAYRRGWFKTPADCPLLGVPAPPAGEVNGEGEVADVRIVSQARESMFTAEAVNMLYSLGPYPPPPAAMLSSDGNTYIHWRFQRDNRACGTFGASVHFLPGEGPVDEGK